MFGNLRLFSWATENPTGRTPHKGTRPDGSSSAPGAKGAPSGWFLDRNWDRAEGERLLNAKKFQQAEKHLLRAAAEAAARKQSAGKRIHLALLLAESQSRQFAADPEDPDFKRLTDAEQTIREAAQIATDSKERSLYILCLDALAEILAQQGKFDAVEKTMLEAIRLESSLRTDKLSAARRVVRLGVARHRMGRIKEAIPVLANAVEMHEKAFGRDHPETAHQLAELGGALRADGRHAEAQIILRRALEIHKALRQQDSPFAIQALHHLAGSLEDVGDLEAAAEQYETALSFKHRTIGSDLDDLAELQYGLANLHISWKNYGRARELLLEAVNNFKRGGGLRLAVTHETLAYVDECSGRYNEAVSELAHAGKVWESMRPERTQELIRNMERRVEMLEQLRRKGEAAHLLDKIVILNHQLEDELEKGLVLLDNGFGNDFDLQPGAEPAAGVAQPPAATYVLDPAEAYLEQARQAAQREAQSAAQNQLAAAEAQVSGPADTHEDIHEGIHQDDALEPPYEHLPPFEIEAHELDLQQQDPYSRRGSAQHERDEVTVNVDLLESAPHQPPPPLASSPWGRSR